jgi:hypothetical protein
MNISDAIISYVIHEKDGASLAKEFLASLRKFPAKTPVTLLVSVKCLNPQFLEQIKVIFADGDKGLRITVEQVPDAGFDLGSHYLVARQNPGVILIFMSASSRVAHPDWFQLLIAPFNKIDVGAVGCMISFESIRDSYLELVRTRVKSKLHLKMSDFELATARSREIYVPKFQISLGQFGNFVARLFTKWICHFLRNEEPLNYSMLFPAFPNPHLRTTGFAVRANLLLVAFDRFPRLKYESFHYESGNSNVSRRIFIMGYQVLHCDYKGKYENFDQVSVPTSFRVQKGRSLVSDRESRRYHSLSPDNQVALNRITFDPRD